MNFEIDLLNKTQVFHRSKEFLASSVLLVHYDSIKEIVLACDETSYWIGAVISHIMENSKEKVITYASHNISAAEKNYSFIDKEYLAVINGMKNFYQMLCD